MRLRRLACSIRVRKRLCKEVAKMSPPWGNTHSCIKISSSPCLLNDSHSPANCFEARPVNPQWDLALLIELARSYRNISLLSIFEREICLFTLPLPPLNLLQCFCMYPSIFCLMKAFLLNSFHSATGKKDNVTKIGRIHIMSQDLIHWAIGIPFNTAVSKYAYSECIISRGEDPKWQIPSPPFRQFVSST